MSQQEKKDKGKEQPEPYNEDKFPKYVLVADVNKIKNYIFASVRLRHIVNASALLAHVNETLTRDLVKKKYGGKIIFTGGGVTQAIFTNKEQAEACREKIEAIYPEQTDTATAVAHLETWETPLEFRFDIGLEFQSNLDNKQAPEVLQEEFPKHGFSISQNAIVSIRKRGEEWRITDDNNQKYTVKKEEGKLKVYDGEEFVDVIRRALRKVRQKKDAATVDSEAKNEDSKPLIRSQPTFEPIAFSSGSPFFRICSQTGKEFATRWATGPDGDRQAFGESVWTQQVRRPKGADEVDFNRGDRLKADPVLRKRIAEALKAQGIEIEPSRFKYATDFEKVTKDAAKPQNYLGFMDADGNGFGNMLSKLADAHATEEDYEAFSNLLEKTTRKAYIEASAKVLMPFLREQINRNQIKVDSQDSIRLPIRLLILGGDDILVVTLPQLVLPLANEFCRLFQEISNQKRKRSTPIVQKLEPFTMSAGVVIAHHGFPFLSFQRLGNRLLKNAKKRAWAARRDREEFYGSVDFQIITASGAEDLKTLREEVYQIKYKDELEISLTGRPYLVSDKEDELRYLRHTVARMKEAGISRRQIKALHDVLRRGEKRGYIDFLRWFSQLKGQPVSHGRLAVQLREQLKIRLTQKEIVRDLFRKSLFTIPIANFADFDEGVIPEELRNALEKRDFTLPDDAKIAIQKREDRWAIVDKNQSPLYILQKEVDWLHILHDANILLPSPWIEDNRPGMKNRSPKHYTPLLDAVELFDIPDNLAKSESNGKEE